jgi:acetyl/propionyl-CoA carboxylase alpha subunit
MNTRLQVEHPVTEMITGVDLVALQLSIAEGHAIPADLLIEVPLRGHAIEVRLCAEDPFRGYLPSSGVFHRVHFPAAPGVRVDSAIESGSEVPPYYDSMIAKVIAHGQGREIAARRLITALEATTLHGPITNRALLVQLLQQLTEVDGPQTTGVDTGWLDRQHLGEGPQPEPMHIAAAALAVVHQRSRSSRLPIGWRNNPSQLHSQPLVGRASGDHVVQYRFDRSNRLQLLVVDGRPIELDTFNRDTLSRIDTAIYPDSNDSDTIYVAGGRHAFVVPPRFTSPDEAGRAGSTVAPLPGRVVKLLVAIGDAVAAGQPLLTIEAMKMEHQVQAPHAGTVVEIFVHAGQQLDGGQPLLKVDPT